MDNGCALVWTESLNTRAKLLPGISSLVLIIFCMPTAFKRLKTQRTDEFVLHMIQRKHKTLLITLIR